MSTMNMYDLRMISDKILVLLEDSDTEVEGIILPEDVRPLKNWGMVIDAGPDAEYLSVGDEVYVEHTEGTRFIQDDSSFVIIREERIPCKKL